MHYPWASDFETDKHSDFRSAQTLNHKRSLALDTCVALGDVSKGSRGHI